MKSAFMQAILNIAGNAVKFTKESHISITASVAKPDSLRDPRDPEFYPIANVEHFYLLCRFASIMEGRIWLESEGVGKGCTATFIVKLGASENSNGHLQQIVPVSGPSNGDADISGARALFKDENKFVPSRLLYQKSIGRKKI